MFIAEMWSESRTWLSLGETKHEAKEAIRKKWNESQKDLVRSGWINIPHIYKSVEDLERNYDIDIVCLNAGECEVR